MRRVISFFIISLILIPATGCYAHGPWRGKVIEAGTKKPIEGAAVVAVWFSLTRLNPAGNSRAPMKVVETVTDANGEFYFSSKHFIDVTILREVSGPDFLVYKPGYDVFQLGYVQYGPNEHPLYKNGFAVIELPKLAKEKDRLKAYRSANDFNLLFRNKTSKLNELIKEEEKYLSL